jgi:TRAP-type C4-dicarboxylate transport system substrate-binding protein
MNKKTWDTLQPAERDVMLKSAAACGQEFQMLGRKESQESVESMQKRGLHVQPVNQDVEAAWQQFSEGFYPKIRGNIVPADMFDKVMQILRDYRASAGVSGK